MKGYASKDAVRNAKPKFIQSTVPVGIDSALIAKHTIAIIISTVLIIMYLLPCRIYFYYKAVYLDIIYKISIKSSSV